MAGVGALHPDQQLAAAEVGHGAVARVVKTFGAGDEAQGGRGRVKVQIRLGGAPEAPARAAAGGAGEVVKAGVDAPVGDATEAGESGELIRVGAAGGVDGERAREQGGSVDLEEEGDLFVDRAARGADHDGVSSPPVPPAGVKRSVTRLDPVTELGVKTGLVKKGSPCTCKESGVWKPPNEVTCRFTVVSTPTVAATLPMGPVKLKPATWGTVQVPRFALGKYIPYVFAAPASVTWLPPKLAANSRSIAIVAPSAVGV